MASGGNTLAYAALSAGAPLVPFSFNRQAPLRLIELRDLDCAIIQQTRDCVCRLLG